MPDILYHLWNKSDTGLFAPLLVEAENEWEKLQEQLNKGGNIVLTEVVLAFPASDSLEISEGVKVTLDLNGHSIDGSTSDTLKDNTWRGR